MTHSHTYSLLQGNQAAPRPLGICQLEPRSSSEELGTDPDLQEQ